LALPASPYTVFVDSFFGLSSIREYLRTYLRIPRSPVRATIAVFEESGLQASFRFLEYSGAIVLLLVISQIFIVPGNGLVADLLMTTYFVLAHLVTFAVHYRLVAGRAAIRRSSAEFLRFASIFLGFTIPISSAVQVTRLAQPTTGALLLLVLTIPLLLYSVRVWQYFWGLRALTTLFYLWVSSFAGLIAGLLFLLVVGMVVG
jgi:hypothetical protein